jgi:hypothetical protein
MKPPPQDDPNLGPPPPDLICDICRYRIATIFGSTRILPFFENEPVTQVVKYEYERTWRECDECAGPISRENP